MPTTTSPPILIWQPEGGIPGGSPVSNPPVYSQADVTQLIEGQAYIDVVFGSIQTSEDWVLVTCEVENTLDLAPLNIWPGIITDRTAAGFRVQLNGMPDSDSYYLHWAVSGINILPVPATLYLFTGPTSAPFGVDQTFTVKLPPSTTLTGSVTVTPNDGGTGGVFSPSSVVLSGSSPVQHFSYTAAAYGAATISVTNSGTLADPAPIVFTSIAPIYTFGGPTGGSVGVASTNFTVQLSGDATLAVPTTVTPHDGGGGGTFTPTSVLLVAGVPVHFTYTPASGGAKTISVTNDGGLTDPGNLTYTAVGLAYTLTGPSTGVAGTPSTNFTVTLPAGVVGTVVVTMHDASGGGTFTPTTLSLVASGSGTFTYTPASSGAKTISTTNGGGLIDPTSLTYTASAFDPSTIAGLKLWLKADAGVYKDTGATLVSADGDLVQEWKDQSANTYNLSNSAGTERPTYKTNIVNGKPVLRFDGVTNREYTGTDIAISQPNTIFAVGNSPTISDCRFIHASTSVQLLGLDGSGFVRIYAGSFLTAATDKHGAFHSFTAIFNGGSSATYADGVLQTSGAAGSNAIGKVGVMTDGFDNTFHSAGDVAEILIYNSALGTTDRQNVESYLRAKYALP